MSPQDTRAFAVACRTSKNRGLVNFGPVYRAPLQPPRIVPATHPALGVGYPSLRGWLSRYFVQQGFDPELEMDGYL